MANSADVLRCEEVAHRIRRDILDMTLSTGNMGAHLGGSLSMVEIIAALYMGTMKYDVKNSNWEERDRLILSKGHAALSLYPAMAEAGFFEHSLLGEFKKNGSVLTGHPSLHGLPGIEYASGSLGQGLSLGVGACLALRRKGNQTSRVYVIMGDGEVDEGSVWEAAASASHFGLNQLVAIIDSNSIQYDGKTDDVLNMSSMAEKWRSFGWETYEVDGHNVEALLDVFAVKSDKPMIIIANTVKGKGFSFMEGDWRFHNARLSQKQYEQAIEELGE